MKTMADIGEEERGALFLRANNILVDPDSSTGERGAREFVVWPGRHPQVWMLFYHFLNLFSANVRSELGAKRFSYETDEHWKTLARLTGKEVHVGPLVAGTVQVKTIYKRNGSIIRPN